MCKLNKKSGLTRIDPCMRNIIKWLKNKHIPISCCCGHYKYPMTIIIKEGVTSKNGLKREIVYREIFSNKIIPRKKRFYKKDKEGYYYIPECVLENKGVK